MSYINSCKVSYYFFERGENIMAHTTIEHIHEGSGSSDSGMGFLMGMILLMIFLFLMFYYGLPILRNSMSNTAPQINVPGKVDVNVHNSGK